MRNNARIFDSILISFVILLSFQGFSGPLDQVMLIYRGHSFTCRDLTGLSLKESLHVVQRAQSFVQGMPPVPHSPHILPSLPIFKPSGKPSSVMLEYFWHCFQNEVLADKIRVFLFDDLRERYPLQQNTTYRLDQIDKFCDLFSYSAARLRNIYMKEILENASPSECVSVLSAHGIPVDKFTPTEYKLFYKMKPFYIVENSCFPTRINKHCGPWLKDYLLGELIFYHLKALIKKDPVLWRHVYERHYSRYEFIDIRNLPPSSKTVMKIILCSLVSNDGSIAYRGLNVLRITLAKMGSNITIDVRRGVPIDEIAEEYGVKPTDIHLMALLQCHQKEATSRSAKSEEYVFPICREKPATVFSKNHIPMDIYRIACKEILAPMLKEILSRTKVMKPLTLPPTEQILGACCGMAVFLEEKSSCGIKLPGVILDCGY